MVRQSVCVTSDSKCLSKVPVALSVWNSSSPYSQVFSFMISHLPSPRLFSSIRARVSVWWLKLRGSQIPCVTVPVDAQHHSKDICKSKGVISEEKQDNVKWGRGLQEPASLIPVFQDIDMSLPDWTTGSTQLTTPQRAVLSSALVAFWITKYKISCYVWKV